jgi:hypothetical protein
MSYLKVKDHNHFLRDANTNSIINNNMTDYQEYISRRDNKNEENEKIQNLESDVFCIKNDLNEIKSLLKELLKQ